MVQAVAKTLVGELVETGAHPGPRAAPCPPTTAPPPPCTHTAAAQPEAAPLPPSQAET